MRLCTLVFCPALIIIVGAGPALGVRGLPHSVVLIAGVRLMTETSALVALILAQVAALQGVAPVLIALATVFLVCRSSLIGSLVTIVA